MFQHHVLKQNNMEPQREKNKTVKKSKICISLQMKGT